MGDAVIVGDLYRLIVFDLDGTLIDSRQDLADSANALVTERGGQALPTDDVARMVGEGAAMLVRRALEAARLPMDETSVPRFLELYDQRLLNTTVVYPGTQAALEALSSRSALAVLTNKPIAPTRRILDGLGLARFFDSVLGGDGPLPRKPDPASMRHLMQAHRVREDETVLVGDSRIDLETARAAGIDICLVRFGFPHDSFPAAHLRGDEGVAHTADDLAAILTQLFAGRERRRA